MKGVAGLLLMCATAMARGNEFETPPPFITSPPEVVERMLEMAGLDNPNGSPFMVGDKQREWLAADLAKAARPDAIIATNPSSFLVTDLAKGMAHPERMVGLHYF